MPTLPATNRLAALQGDVLVTVAALVVHRARIDIDLLCSFGGVRAVIATVLLSRHLRKFSVGSDREGGQVNMRWAYVYGRVDRGGVVS